MSFCNLIIKRCISTTSVNCGKRNFKKFMIYNKRGSKIFKEQQKVNPDPDIPIYSMLIYFTQSTICIYNKLKYK